MRTLAIDLGSRRVGLALSDQGGRLATPFDVLSVHSADQAIPAILHFIRQEEILRIVVGLPLNMDGTIGPAGQGVLAWVRKLRAECNLPVILVDERLSSFAAEQELASRRRMGEKLTRKRKKEQLDAVAAAGFLQAFLDGKLPEIVP